jgi:hypothetical protein
MNEQHFLGLAALATAVAHQQGQTSPTRPAFVVAPAYKPLPLPRTLLYVGRNDAGIVFSTQKELSDATSIPWADFMCIPQHTSPILYAWSKDRPLSLRQYRDIFLVMTVLSRFLYETGPTDSIVSKNTLAKNALEAFFTPPFDPHNPEKLGKLQKAYWFVTCDIPIHISSGYDKYLPLPATANVSDMTLALIAYMCLTNSITNIGSGTLDIAEAPYPCIGKLVYYNCYKSAETPPPQGYDECILGSWTKICKKMLSPSTTQSPMKSPAGDLLATIGTPAHTDHLPDSGVMVHPFYTPPQPLPLPRTPKRPSDSQMIPGGNGMTDAAGTPSQKRPAPPPATTLSATTTTAPTQNSELYA